VNDTRTPPLASNQGKRQKRGRNPPSQAYESRPPQRIQKTIVTLHLQASLNIPDTGWTCRRAWTLELEGGSATRRSICTLDQVPQQSNQETGSRALLLFAGTETHPRFSHPRFFHPRFLRFLRFLQQRFPSRGGGNVMS
jgi:hypothetical protein